MTRLSIAACFLATIAWLVILIASTGCEAATVVLSDQEEEEEGHSSAAAHAPFASILILEANQAVRRMNLRSTNSESSSYSSLSLSSLTTARNGTNEKAEEESTTASASALEGGGPSSSSSFFLMSKTNRNNYKNNKAGMIPKESSLEWARQLGISQKDVDLIVKAYHAKQANLAVRHRFFLSSSTNHRRRRRSRLFKNHPNDSDPETNSYYVSQPQQPQQQQHSKTGNTITTPSFLDTVLQSSSSSSSMRHLASSSSASSSSSSSFSTTGNLLPVSNPPPRGLRRKTQESNTTTTTPTTTTTTTTTMEACTTAAADYGYYTATTCTVISDNPNNNNNNNTNAVLGGCIVECIDPCITCDESSIDDDTDDICAIQSTQYYYEAETTTSTSISKTYTYTSGKEDTTMVKILETGCTIDPYGYANCTTNGGSGGGACVASVNGTICNSCALHTCSDGTLEYPYVYPGYVLDCTNVGSVAPYTVCDGTIIARNDPLYILGNQGVYCKNQGTVPCEAEKALRTQESDSDLDSSSLYCQCSDSNDGNVQLKRSEQCGLLCNDRGDVCGRSSTAKVFSSLDGSVLYTTDIFEYQDNRRYELQVLESMENCTFSFYEPMGSGHGSCECFIQTCAASGIIAEAPRVDCTRTSIIMGSGAGKVLDLCPSDEPAVAVGTVFEYMSFDNCLDLSPANDVCSDSAGGATLLVLDGSITTGSIADAMYYPADSCYGTSDDVGLWCKCKQSLAVFCCCCVFIIDVCSFHDLSLSLYRMLTPILFCAIWP
jgi:hypothetical protein